MRELWVPPHWVRITDPELCWLAMIAAREGEVLHGFFSMIVHEHGGLDLFSFRDGDRRRSYCAQRSLAGRVNGQRFVVVWSPEELDRAPEVYQDPTWKAPQ